MDVSRFYEAARRAGFLVACTWTPANGAEPITQFVDYSAPNQRKLDGLAITQEATVKFPTHWFAGIRKGDGITVAGSEYVVGEVVAVGDGSETEVVLRKPR
ncbi:MAG: hypothetical protein LBE75_06460 [Burkholderiales bacterium]|jgi:hypothetical protein|nr:hypothetical protein [Burkholderiales bacterium]